MTEDMVLFAGTRRKMNVFNQHMERRDEEKRKNINRDDWKSGREQEISTLVRQKFRRRSICI